MGAPGRSLPLGLIAGNGRFPVPGGAGGRASRRASRGAVAINEETTSRSRPRWTRSIGFSLGSSAAASDALKGGGS
jgi:hypothetical protein